jgi:sphinganine-1-phosphate aldolase
MIVCVGSEELNIYNVGDLMTKRGWSLNSLQSPAGLHLCVTLRHVGRHERFLKDIREVRADVLVSAVGRLVAQSRRVTEGRRHDA